MQRVEHESSQDNRTLRLDLEQCTLRLRAYEALEEEIDSAVVRTAGLYGSSGVDGVDGVVGEYVWCVYVCMYVYAGCM